MRQRPTIRTRPGQALVEVTIGTLIAAMTTISVFSVVLSAMVSQGRADKREAAALVIKQAQESLKSYVSADPLNSDLFPGVVDAYGLSKTGSPRGQSGSVGRWAYDNTGSWALAAGQHNITSMLAIPPNPVNYPLAGGSFTYNVTDLDCGFGTGEKACKMVVFTLTYPD